MSVVLVVATGMFFLRDNIAKFINNAATQIAGEESGDGLNEYGFYFEKKYVNPVEGEYWIFHEDGTATLHGPDGTLWDTNNFTYSNSAATNDWGGVFNFSPDGKSIANDSWVLQE